LQDVRVKLNPGLSWKSGIQADEKEETFTKYLHYNLRNKLKSATFEAWVFMVPKIRHF
jgi:hypothetical protein